MHAVFYALCILYYYTLFACYLGIFHCYHVRVIRSHDRKDLWAGHDSALVTTDVYTDHARKCGWRSHAESRNIPHGHGAHCLLMWKRIADDVDALLLQLSDRRCTTGTPDYHRCRSVKDAFTYTTFWSVAVNYAKGSCSSSDWIFHCHFRSLIVWMTGPRIHLLLYNRLY